MQEEKGVKIGARVLDDDTLRILIPDYESIFSEIEKIRGNITSVETQGESKTGLIKPPDDEFFKHHNNIFSILGERGAGKTSVQLTLKYKLGQIDDVINSDKTEEKDVVKHVAKDVDTILPIIVPQDMDDDSSVIGWIIAHFSNIIKDLFKVEERCYYFNEKDEEKIKKLKARFEDLKKSYFLRQDTYKSSLSVEDTIHNYVQKNEEVIRENIDLSKKFKVFIDEFIEFRKNNKKTNPLIFIFFDDVDISNKRCLMVLETLLRYLSHSNIVVFVAGDYLTFKETITLSYLKEDGLLDKELMVQTFEKKSALEIRQTLAYDYLKKVLSPALRYELKTLSLENKKTFKCKKDSLSLEELLKEKVQFLDPFYEIFDSKPRGLINIYYFLKNTDRNMDVDELKRFTNTIIDSSSVLNVKKEEIEKIIKFNSDVEINLTKFNKNDYTETNLKILLLVLFLGEQNGLSIKEHEKEVLEYFKNYLNEKIEIVGELRRPIDIFDIFLEGKNISQNLELFYNILVQFEEKKITQNKFYQRYFSQILKINKESNINKYYAEHIYLNKDRVRKISAGLKRVSNTIETNLEQEMELRFKNLYLLDEWRNVVRNKIKEEQNLEFKELKKEYEFQTGLSQENMNLLKKETEFILNAYNLNETENSEGLTISDKIKLMEKEIEKVKSIAVEIYNYVEKNPEILKEIKKIQTFEDRDYFNKNNMFTSTIKGYTHVYTLKRLLDENYQITFFNLDEIILDLRNSENYKNKIFEIDEILQKLEKIELEILEGKLDDIEKRLVFLDENEENTKLLIFGVKLINERKKLYNELLKHISSQKILNKLNQGVHDKSFKETIEKLESMYEKILYFEIFEKLENEEKGLEIVSNLLLDLEDKFIQNKKILELKNAKVLKFLREEKLFEFEGYLNSENYINSKELKERYNSMYTWRKEEIISEWRELVYEYIRKELRMQNINVLVTEKMELENLAEIFMKLYRIIEKNKNKSKSSSEIEPKRFEELYKSLSQEPLLKRYF